MSIETHSSPVFVGLRGVVPQAVLQKASEKAAGIVGANRNCMFGKCEEAEPVGFTVPQ